MEKILILSYCYPPCNFTASFRPYSWVKNFPAEGFETIVVTRSWDIPIVCQNDGQSPTGIETRIESGPNFEIRYLPYKGNLRDQLLAKHGKNKYIAVRKLLIFFELIAQNYIVRLIPYKNLYEECRVILKNNPDIQWLIVTANPYPQFFFAYLLKKEFPHIQWIADYRDDWSTRQFLQKRGRLRFFIRGLERHSERKWLCNCAFITSVSDVLTARIAKFLGKEGYTIANGFIEEDYERLSGEVDPKSFVVTYTGHLYPDQNLEEFALVFKKLVERFSDQIKLKMRFIGAAADTAARRSIMKVYSEIENNIELTARMDKEECLKLEASTDVFLSMAYGDLKGIPTSKLYQYLGHRKPIVLFPNDGDIIEMILLKTNAGIMAGSTLAMEEKMAALIQKKINGEAIFHEIQTADVAPYSRKAQSAKLARLLR